MSGWLAPALLPAVLVMVVFVFVPRRLWFVQLAAVLGWAAVWQDDRLTAHWVDLTGAGVVVACVLVWLSAAWRTATRTREQGTRR